MNKKQIDRLLRLVDFLRELPPENFDMGDWSSSGPISKRPKCGTTACIGGWSTLFFPELELYDNPDSLGKDLRIAGNKYLSSSVAISRAWGISIEDAERICMPDVGDIPVGASPIEASNLLAKVVERYAAESGYDIIDEE